MGAYSQRVRENEKQIQDLRFNLATKVDVQWLGDMVTNLDRDQRQRFADVEKRLARIEAIQESLKKGEQE